MKDLVVVHFPEGAFARTRRGEDFWQSSLKLPQGYIAGTAGAGDAFCAGADLNWMKSMVDYGLDQNVADSRALAEMFRALANEIHL